jgi:hypothetical protein
VTFTGEEPPVVARERIEAGLVEGLGRGAIETIPSTEVAAAAPEAKGCADAACYASVAEKTSASHIVRTVVEVGEREYDVMVELVDASNGDVVATSQGACDICGVAEAADLAADHAAGLRSKLEAIPSGPGILTINSTPSDATVRIDGEDVGTTPLEVRLSPGGHAIAISKAGYTTLERKVSSVAGVREILTLELQEAPDVRRKTSTWGWISLGLGVGAAGAGGAMLGIHHKPHQASCEGQEDENGVCPWRYNTLAAGIALTVAGAAAITTGIVLLVRSKKGTRKKKDRDRDRPVAINTAGGQLQLQF